MNQSIIKGREEERSEGEGDEGTMITLSKKLKEYSAAKSEENNNNDDNNGRINQLNQIKSNAPPNQSDKRFIVRDKLLIKGKYHPSSIHF